MTDTPGLEQLRRLQRVTDAALGNLAVDDLLDELLMRVAEVLRADTAAVLLLSEDGTELVARAARGIEEEVERGVRIPLGKGFAGRIAAERKPVIVDRVDHRNVLNPILREKNIRSLLGVPMVVEGSVLGVLHVGTLQERVFDAEDIELLQLVGDRLALALKVRLYEREHFVAATLQRSFMPTTLPEIPGLSISAHYQSAPGGVQVGGDWYDVFVLPSGSVAIAIGDIAGSGLNAASLMGQIRNALRAYVLEGHSPGEVAERLDRHLAYFDTGEIATLLYGTFDALLTRFHFVNAGHVPPLILGSKGPRFVEPSRPQPPLGTSTIAKFREDTVQLEASDGLLVYTDGLIERRSEPLSVGMEKLRVAAAEIEWPIRAHDAVRMLAAAMFASTEPVDDVAMVMIVREGVTTNPFDVRVAAKPRQLAVIRQAMRRWMSDRDIPPSTAGDLLTACGEACANAIEHAHSGAEGSVRVQLRTTPERVELEVSDDGTWRQPRGVGRGRGLMLMEATMDSVNVQRSPHGTTVKMTRQMRGS